MSNFNGYPLEDVFELVEDTFSQVIIKVNAEDPLKLARYPFINGDWAYITLSGLDKYCKVVTFIKHDGSTWSINYGSSTTCVSENLINLTRALKQYLLEVHGINADGYHCREVGEGVK